MIDLLYNVALNLSNAEVICGPAYRKIHTIFDDRFQQLKSFDVELHFFAHGPAYSKDFETWTRKESEKYLDSIAVIDKIDSNVPIEKIKKLEKPPGATTSTYDLLAICKKYGTVHVSLNSKYIADVVKYSNSHNVLAIVGNSSHFLIFDGDWRYWSCRDIGLTEQSWNTLEFNKSALLEYIGLSQLQMAMLATIAGNEFVTFETVVLFHRRIHGSGIVYHKEHFLKLAEYVQQIPNVLANDERREFLLDLFGSSDFHYFEMVRNSLHFYTNITQEIQQMDSLLTLAASISDIYYNSLTNASIRIKMPSFFDLRRTDFLPFIDIALPILKRQIGLVRKHKNDPTYQQTIELQLSHSEPIGSIHLTPEYPIGKYKNFHCSVNLLIERLFLHLQSRYLI